MDWFSWGLSINDALTTKITSQVITIALVIGAICFICSLGYNYVKHGIESFLSEENGKFPDYSMIARSIVMIFCITLYLPIAKTLIGTMEVVNQVTSMDGSYQGEFDKYANEFLEMQKIENQQQMDRALEEEAKYGEMSGYAVEEIDKQKSAEQKDSFFSVKEILNVLNPVNWVAATLHALTKLLCSLIKLIILGITTIVIKVLVIVGPLSFAFSILPVFNKQLEQWFGTLLTAGFVFTTLNILDMISFDVIRHITDAGKSMEEQDSVAFVTLVIDVVIIFVYCSSFWLTSKYVGRGDAGKILSKTIGTITTLAALTVGGSQLTAAKGAQLESSKDKAEGES